MEGVLSRQWLQAEVEARNPTLEAMAAAWQAAAQIYPQRVALDDPVLMGMIAPQSVGASTTETAYAFQLNQKMPWHGKRSLRGAVAAADADAACQEVEDSRLQVRLAADLAFYEYFLVTRLLELNGQNVQKMQEFYESAQARYRTNRAEQQDILQAELERADLARRQLELERMRQVAIARINTLLRRWPDAPLPPPPGELEPSAGPEDKDLAWQTALQQRPDLAALAWRVQAAEAALELAYKNYYPDFDTFARYDTWWQPASTQGPLRTQIGVAMNLPVYRQKLRAAVCEAQFRLNQRRAEFDERALQIQYEVLSAAEQVEESRKTIELYSQRLIPAAEQNVQAARTSYDVGKLNFLQLAQTQRQLIAIRERQIEALVAYHRRAAELTRTVGNSVISRP
jgi:cobalt-zinc-cadmium efflux system outer membrane protein